MKIAIPVIGAFITSSLLIGGVAFAQSATPPSGTYQGHGYGGQSGRVPGVFGTVASIDGTTLTVTSKGFGSNTTATTYSVDASTATVTKSGATASVSDIAVGDTVMVQGTVSGTSVTATAIRDGIMTGTGQRPQGTQKPQTSSGNTVPPTPASTPTPTAPVTQPANVPSSVSGNVTAINGTTLTVVDGYNNSYTVDASSSTVQEAGANVSLTSVAVGDNVLVQGTVNGTSVTATSITDQGAGQNASTFSASSTATVDQGFVGGIMSAIGGFFQHLFGFF